MRYKDDGMQFFSDVINISYRRIILLTLEIYRSDFMN